MDLIRKIHNKELVVLSRWDVDDSGSLKFFDNNGSQDVWIFRGVPENVDGNIKIGIPGCENRIAYEFKSNGYSVKNVGRIIKAIHLHLSGLRNYTEQDRYTDYSRYYIPPVDKEGLSEFSESKIISYSLFGGIPCYSRGFLENVKIRQSIYPDWKIRVYASMGDYLVKNAVTESQKVDCGIEVIDMGRSNGLIGTFWRFLVAEDNAVDRFICRDSDSLLNIREKKAVDEWVDDGSWLHCIRDYHGHNHPIYAGMFGGSSEFIREMSLLKLFSKELKNRQSSKYEDDEVFLRGEIYPRFKDKMLSHVGNGSPNVYGKTLPLTIPLPNGRFVGGLDFR